MVLLSGTWLKQACDITAVSYLRARYTLAVTALQIISETVLAERLMGLFPVMMSLAVKF